jgi:hypothetical protein
MTEFIYFFLGAFMSWFFWFLVGRWVFDNIEKRHKAEIEELKRRPIGRLVSINEDEEGLHVTGQLFEDRHFSALFPMVNDLQAYSIAPGVVAEPGAFKISEPKNYCIHGFEPGQCTWDQTFRKGFVSEQPCMHAKPKE